MLPAPSRSKQTTGSCLRRKSDLPPSWPTKAVIFHGGHYCEIAPRVQFWQTELSDIAAFAGMSFLLKGLRFGQVRDVNPSTPPGHQRATAFFLGDKSHSPFPDLPVAGCIIRARFLARGHGEPLPLDLPSPATRSTPVDGPRRLASSDNRNPPRQVSDDSLEAPEDRRGSFTIYHPYTFAAVVRNLQAIPLLLRSVPIKRPQKRNRSIAQAELCLNAFRHALPNPKNVPRSTHVLDRRSVRSRTVLPSMPRELLTYQPPAKV